MTDGTARFPLGDAEVFKASLVAERHWEKATFSIGGDDDEAFVGFHDPRVRWNGWACPFFPKDEADRFAASNARRRSAYEEVDIIEWSEAKQGYYVFLPEENESVESGEFVEATMIPDVGPCWPIGSWYYVWLEVAPEVEVR